MRSDLVHRDKVILVDENDQEIGVMGKDEAHQSPNLHRAFSIFIFNDKNQLLLQKRAYSKYHSAGLWTNTCCSHPQPGENIQDSAVKRLWEEMGISTELEDAFSFIYQAEFDNGLIEYELDHVFVGNFNKIPQVNLTEVADWKYMDLNEVEQDMYKNPENYTAWFRICLPRIREHVNFNEFQNEEV